jgi:aspartate/methionine/tyrosine aminotransferase
MPFVERAIKEKELLLVPGHIFTEKQSHIRISYAVEEETLERGLSALLELLS